MPRHGNYLTAAFVTHAKKKDNNTTVDKYHDNRGMGLFLEVRVQGYKLWKQRVRIRGRRREISLGSFPSVSLVEAREAAYENHRAARQGRDILAERRAFRREITQSISFEEQARQRFKELVASKKWRNQKHAAQWISTLETYTFPIIGADDIREIEPLAIKRVLMQKVAVKVGNAGGKGEDKEAFWHARPETARRLRQRMDDVFKYAIAQGLRADNPVEAIAAALPPQMKKPKHHRALPYAEVPAAIAKVRGGNCHRITALSFEWLILTATRVGETRLARWREIDFEAKVWTIPAERMKAGKEHRVPLAGRCLAILNDLKAISRADPDDLIFHGRRADKPLSENTHTKLMRDHGLDAVPHGFRSSFRIWLQEQTDTPREIAETCLAHSNQNKVEAAYARSDYLEKRRGVMGAWADYVTGKG